MGESASTHGSPAVAPVCATGVTMLTGPLLIGFLVAYCLFGVLCTQVYTYWVAFPKDKIALKIFVWTVFVLELTALVLNTNTAWWFFGSGYGQMSHFIQFDPTSPLQPLIAGIITAMFHSFYSWRIYTLSKKIALPIIIILITLTQLGMTMYIAIHGTETHGYVEAITERSFRTLYAVWQAAGIGADLIVTTGMAYILWRAKRLTTSERTVNRINTLIKYTAETGALITFFEIVNVILYLVSNHTFLFFMVYYILTKLYSNTLLSSLNSRVIFVSENPAGARSNARGMDISNNVVLSTSSSPTPYSPRVRISSWRDDVEYDSMELSVVTPAYFKDVSPPPIRFPGKTSGSEDV